MPIGSHNSEESSQLSSVTTDINNNVSNNITTTNHNNNNNKTSSSSDNSRSCSIRNNERTRARVVAVVDVVVVEPQEEPKLFHDACQYRIYQGTSVQEMFGLSLLQLHDDSRYSWKKTTEIGLVLPLDFIQGLDNIRDQEADIRISECLQLQLCHHPVDSSPILTQPIAEDNNRIIGRVPSGTVGDYQPPLQRVHNAVNRHRAAALQIPQSLCLGYDQPSDRLERSAVKRLVGIHAGYQVESMCCALHVLWQLEAHAVGLVKDCINRDVFNFVHIPSLGIHVKVHIFDALHVRIGSSLRNVCTKLQKCIDIIFAVARRGLGHLVLHMELVMYPPWPRREHQECDVLRVETGKSLAIAYEIAGKECVILKSESNLARVNPLKALKFPADDVNLSDKFHLRKYNKSKRKKKHGHHKSIYPLCNLNRK
ncbi:Hypothetical predicted protein [Octopus vulgaris]|uniref:Uncharacterized protein n=1 Tax=Octopus vulgaris TaxID=6645 RepID=A0AA36AET9_OCTVU|nr:Hypothetical predicted protein [Octopus vulgaris]